MGKRYISKKLGKYRHLATKNTLIKTLINVALYNELQKRAFSIKSFGQTCFVGYFRIIQKFINNYTEYYPWERVSTRGIGTSTTRTL